jgi:hypothetical protein
LEKNKDMGKEFIKDTKMLFIDVSEDEYFIEDNHPVVKSLIIKPRESSIDI